MTEHVPPARRPSSSFERQAPPAHDVQRCIMPAGRIPRARDDLGDLKRAHPLADVLTSYGVALRGSGPHRMACCPFHDDHTPSLGVYLDTDRFFCFRCGASGDVVALVQRFEHVGFPEAVRRLRERAGFGDDRDRRVAPSGAGAGGGHPAASIARRPQATGVDTRGPRARPAQAPGRLRGPDTLDPLAVLGDVTLSATGRMEWRVIGLLTAVAALYRHALGEGTADASRARAYLRARSVPTAVAARAGLGYADGATLLPFLSHAPATLALARAIGLLNEAGRERLRGRVIVPEMRGELCVWLHGRWLPSAHYDEAGGMRERPRHTAYTPDLRKPAVATPPPKYLGLALPKPLLGLGLALAERSPREDDGGLCAPPAERGTAGSPRQIREDSALAHGISLGLAHSPPCGQGLLVVEGSFDLLTALAWDVPLPCAALVGTHASGRQCRELLALADGGPIWLALDADAPGEEGAARLAAQLAPVAGDVHRVRPPGGAKDFAEVASSVEAREAILQVLTAVRTEGRGDEHATDGEKVDP